MNLKDLTNKLKNMKRETKQNFIVVGTVTTLIAIGIGYVISDLNNEEEKNNNKTETESETTTVSKTDLEADINDFLSGRVNEVTVNPETISTGTIAGQVTETQQTTIATEQTTLLPYEKEFTYENFVETCELFMKNNNIPEEQYEHIAATAMLCNINHVPANVFKEYLKTTEGIDFVGLSNTYIYGNISNSIDNRDAKCTDLSELIFNEKDRESIHAVVETVQELINAKEKVGNDLKEADLKIYKETLTSSVAKYMNTALVTETQSHNKNRWPFSFAECDYNIRYIASKYAICIETHYMNDLSGIYITPKETIIGEYGVSFCGATNEDYIKKLDSRYATPNFDVNISMINLIENNEQTTVNPLYDVINQLEEQCNIESEKTKTLN